MANILTVYSNFLKPGSNSISSCFCYPNINGSLNLNAKFSNLSVNVNSEKVSSFCSEVTLSPSGFSHTKCEQN